MFQNIGLSRSALFVKKQISYKRRYDLEDIDTSNIWIELAINKSKNCMVMGGYRQWRLLLQMDKDNDKDLNKKQLMRFQKTLEKWKIAIDENKDVIVITDDNLDSNENAEQNKLYKVRNLQDLLDAHFTREQHL